jgi:D-serine deaminase-like pyridoxal phosphate-dependent protein
MTRPRILSEISTPALIVDVPTLERNIRRMADFFASGPCKLRPHFKAHKTLEISRRQLAAGSCRGITCATVAEAEAVADICGDVLLANEVVDRAKCDRVAMLARKTHMTVVVDSLVGLQQIAAAAHDAGVTIGVLIDINVGQGRCGVTPGDEALALARQISRTPSLGLRGVMGYEGHVQPMRNRSEREARACNAMQALVITASRMLASGLPCEIVSAGGTGTYDISGRVEGVTEIQAGSYALMDSDYAEVGLPFEQAFWVLGTIISRPAPDRAVADCGHKSVTKDHGNPVVKGIEGASVTALNDEHATIALPASVPLTVGDRIQLIPSHTDPTINLHDVFYAIEGARVVDVWPISRGYS